VETLLEQALNLKMDIPVRARRSSVNITPENAMAQITMTMMESGSLPLDIFIGLVE